MYKKKPATVVASKLTRENAEDVATWCNGVVVEDINTQAIGVDVPTLRGVVRAKEGEYVVKENDDFWTSPAEVFEAAYDVIF